MKRPPTPLPQQFRYQPDGVHRRETDLEGPDGQRGVAGQPLSDAVLRTAECHLVDEIIIDRSNRFVTLAVGLGQGRAAPRPGRRRDR